MAVGVRRLEVDGVRGRQMVDSRDEHGYQRRRTAPGPGYNAPHLRGRPRCQQRLDDDWPIATSCGSSARPKWPRRRDLQPLVRKRSPGGADGRPHARGQAAARRQSVGRSLDWPAAPGAGMHTGALRRGDIAMDVSGDRNQPLIEIATRAMIRSLPAVTRAIVVSLAALASLGRGRRLEAWPQDQAADAPVRRDAQGHATVRATRLTAPLRVDGQLDEEIYRSAVPVSGFIETEPVSDRPAQERTEVWVFFDDENVYVAARCWESAPERRVANEMRRDNGGVSRATTSPSRSTRSTTGATASCSTSTRSAAGCDGQVTNGSGSTTATGIRCGTPRPASFDGGWTRRDRVPVQVAALPAGPGSDVGRSTPAARDRGRTRSLTSRGAAGDRCQRGHAARRLRRRWSAFRRRRRRGTSR